MLYYGNLRGEIIYILFLVCGSFLTHMLVLPCSGCIVCFSVLGVCYFLMTELWEGFSPQFYLVNLLDS